MDYEEEWKDCIGYEQYFKVSNYGRVFSKRTNKLLKLTISKTGYLTFSTRIGGRKGECKYFKVHRLVAFAFIRNDNNKPFVNHIDLNKLNNTVDNLEWVTAKENVAHAIENGAFNLSSFVQASIKRNIETRILSETDVYYILDNYRKNKVSMRKIANILGVSRGMVRSVIDKTSYFDLIEKYNLNKGI